MLSSLSLLDFDIQTFDPYGGKNLRRIPERKKHFASISHTAAHLSAHQLQKLSTHKVNCLQNITLLKTHQEANFRRKSKLPASLAQPCQRARGGHIKIFYTPCSSKFLNPCSKILFFLIIILYQICGMVIVYQLHAPSDN